MVSRIAILACVLSDALRAFRAGLRSVHHWMIHMPLPLEVFRREDERTATRIQQPEEATLLFPTPERHTRTIRCCLGMPYSYRLIPEGSFPVICRYSTRIICSVMGSRQA